MTENTVSYGERLVPCGCSGPDDARREHGCEPLMQFHNTGCAITDPIHRKRHQVVAKQLAPTRSW